MHHPRQRQILFRAMFLPIVCADAWRNRQILAILLPYPHKPGSQGETGTIALPIGRKFAYPLIGWALSAHPIKGYANLRPRLL